MYSFISIPFISASCLAVLWELMYCKQPSCYVLWFPIIISKNIMQFQCCGMWRSSSMLIGENCVQNVNIVYNFRDARNSSLLVSNTDQRKWKRKQFKDKFCSKIKFYLVKIEKLLKKISTFLPARYVIKIVNIICLKMSICLNKSEYFVRVYLY